MTLYPFSGFLQESRARRTGLFQGQMLTSSRRSEVIEACPEALKEIQRNAFWTGFLLPAAAGLAGTIWSARIRCGVLLSSNRTVSIMMSARAFQFRDDLPTSPGRSPGWAAKKKCALASHRLASLTISVDLR
jgi:hypothetical protein